MKVQKYNKVKRIIICNVCGITFETYRLRQKYCSRVCGKIHKKCLNCKIICNKSISERSICTEKFKNYANIKEIKEIKCPTCGILFKINRPRQKYCSKACTLSYRKSCIICGKYCKIGRMFCSNECKNISLKLRLKKNEELKSTNYIEYKNKEITQIINSKCIRCKKDTNIPSDCRHHIIPRIFGGIDDDSNRITLCNKCHDFIEEKTDEWIKSGKYYNIELLKTLIINDGF